MTKFLYSSSLEKHMKEYMKGVDLQNQNNQYQLAQAQIVKEGEAMQLSRAEIQNKIEMMKQTLKENIAKKLLPPEKVAPVVQVARDQYKPMTASEYENNLRKRFKATGQLLPDFPEVPVIKTKAERKQTVDAILSLYKDKPTSTELIEALTNEIKSTALAKQQRKDMNKKLNITQLEQEVKKNFDEISKNRKVSNALQDEILRSLNNLKPVKIIEKVKTKSPFQLELEQKVNAANLKKTKPKEIETKEAPMVKALREAEGKPSKAKSQRKKPIASIASTAPTESDSTTVNPSGSPRDIGVVTFAELKSESYKRLTDYLRSGKITDSQWIQFNKEVKDIGGTGASARLNAYMDGLLQQYGSGLRKHKSKKSKK